MVIALTVAVIICMGWILNTNQRKFIPDKIIVDNVVLGELEHLANKERIFRIENPKSTSEEVLSFLENEIDNTCASIESRVSLLGVRSSVASEYKIFGKTVTSEELALVLAYPAQAVIAFNASNEASNIINFTVKEVG